ncbi:hypothetical protein CEXT_447601 [Caerostris extrusa]|uniref:Uncharacterized protein n=1 Tax=Caerostris extrusa TaxID=172846 RepID=A0AAV4VLE2_CAEEX|nr:hypothetical protein CEXT_447601 [Caerostris extrusa]
MSIIPNLGVIITKPVSWERSLTCLNAWKKKSQKIKQKAIDNYLFGIAYKRLVESPKNHKISGGTPQSNSARRIVVCLKSFHPGGWMRVLSLNCFRRTINCSVTS